MIDLGNDFSPINTFECGQCFRWNDMGDGSYIGISCGRVCLVRDNILDCPSEDDEFWKAYFTFDVDYENIKNLLSKHDEKLKKCIDYGSGLRILKQDVWETIVSFIISANNNIPRIKSIIETLCREFGSRIESRFGAFYSFPSAEKLSTLTLSDLAVLRVGYRDKYIIDAAQKVASKEVDLSQISSLSTDDAKAMLMKIKGVGSKVADCVLLFSLSRWEQFPKDVWINRILNDVYTVSGSDVDEFIQKNYGEYAGFAQQYMYYYYRDNNTN